MKTDTTKLRSIVNKLSMSIEELDAKFYSHDELFNKINMSNIWEGISETACMEKYKELSSQYPYIISSLRSYVKNLNVVIRSYENYENNAQNTIDSNF